MAKMGTQQMCMPSFTHLPRSSISTGILSYSHVIPPHLSSFHPMPCNTNLHSSADLHARPPLWTPLTPQVPRAICTYAGDPRARCFPSSELCAEVVLLRVNCTDMARYHAEIVQDHKILLTAGCIPYNFRINLNFCL